MPRETEPARAGMRGDSGGPVLAQVGRSRGPGGGQDVDKAGSVSLPCRWLFCDVSSRHATFRPVPVGGVVPDACACATRVAVGGCCSGLALQSALTPFWRRQVRRRAGRSCFGGLSSGLFTQTSDGLVGCIACVVWLGSQWCSRSGCPGEGLSGAVLRRSRMLRARTARGERTSSPLSVQPDRPLDEVGRIFGRVQSTPPMAVRQTPLSCSAVHQVTPARGEGTHVGWLVFRRKSGRRLPSNSRGGWAVMRCSLGHPQCTALGRRCEGVFFRFFGKSAWISGLR